MSVGVAALGQSYFSTAEDVLNGATPTTKMTGELVCAEPTVLITGCWQKVIQGLLGKYPDSNWHACNVNMRCEYNEKMHHFYRYYIGWIKT